MQNINEFIYYLITHVFTPFNDVTVSRRPKMPPVTSAAVLRLLLIVNSVGTALSSRGPI